MPAALKPYVSEFDGPTGGRRVFQVDAEAFQRDVEAEARRESQAPTRDEMWGHDEIVNMLFDGDATAFEAAQQLGFPSRTGMRTRGRRLESFWKQQTVRAWASQVTATASALRAR